MKKPLSLTVLMLLTQSAFSTVSYECWRYIDGSPEGYVSVSANSNDEAVKKAEKKFDKIGKRYHYIKCK